MDSTLRATSATVVDEGQWWRCLIFGGLAGALLLSDQISTDRLMDSFRRSREANGLALNDADLAQPLQRFGQSV